MEIRATNVHQLLPDALNKLRMYGVQRDSRNGPVLAFTEPVTVVYEKPWQRVMFHPERDANPALHLYESLWMIQGRKDVAPLIRYAKQFEQYTDDGVTLHGAYGWRWLAHFGMDQIRPIVERLKANPEDRRCVLGIWDPRADLNRNGKDVPCNIIVTLQRDFQGKLDMTVFNRSNDLVWGLAGANAVHFAFLQEYVAVSIGCPIGKYYQISANLHGYLKTLEPLAALTQVGEDPYDHVEAAVPPKDGELYELESFRVVRNADLRADGAATGVRHTLAVPETYWGRTADTVLKAHHEWKTLPAPDRFRRALETLNEAPYPHSTDWVIATREWIQRRQAVWEAKQ